MEKCNRRSFLGKLGWITAGLVSAPYLRANTSASPLSETPSTDPATHSGNSTSAAVTASGERLYAAMSDHGRALCNPNMGWTMHFYSNQLENYGSKLAPSDTLDDFPGLGGALPAHSVGFRRARRGTFHLGNPRHARTTMDRQGNAGVVPHFGARVVDVQSHPAMGVSMPGPKDTMPRVGPTNPITTIPFSWKKSKTSCVQWPSVTTAIRMSHS
ncbi:MAG: hypothetical protein ACLR8Y_11960 [Alistipes indistinctus]